ncbi:MAG: Response regulator [Myxococcales bacterium]|nr:Response regulator [Myxococcales bacterium]
MKRILLVDDDGDLRDLYARYLDDVGYCVAVARDGAEAVDVASMVHPHAIVMDISMPAMNGCEATRRIKSDVETSAVPIVALTGSAPEEIEQEMESSGFARVLQKPCTAPDLASILDDELSV